MESAEKSIVGRALARPEMLKQLFDFTLTNGVKAAYSRVETRLNSLSPLGYSSSGTVVGVGDGVTEFRCGDRIACGGSGYANHCEVNWVPRNLAVRLPDSVPLEAASLTTVGAIAMQGLQASGVAGRRGYRVLELRCGDGEVNHRRQGSVKLRGDGDDEALLA